MSEDASLAMLPSYEVIAGLALVLGASELHFAIKRGKLDDSILMAIGKGLANKLGDGLQATGAAAKRVVDRFKGDPEVKKAILGAEEEVNEQHSHNTSRIKLYEEFFNVNEREYGADERQSMADSGQALPDGSYPIADEEDLKNAIKAYGRAKNQSAAAKHIAKRAKALGLSSLIPQTADFQTSLK